MLLGGCSKNTNQENNVQSTSYGVFLGADSKSIDRISQYKNVVIDIDEFDQASISSLKDRGSSIYSYLSIGSLEKYRPYYEEYKDLTFLDYENWPDERWIDVSNTSWQEHLLSEADRLKGLGSEGIFMDNFDVYYIVCEEYECSTSFKEGIYQGLYHILDELSKKDFKLIINSGTDFLERLSEEKPSMLNKISCYCQECVFSSIEDYEHDVFGKQDKETTDYYKSIIKIMKPYADILLLEYTIDESLIQKIESYSKTNGFYYYISSSVNLN